MFTCSLLQPETEQVFFVLQYRLTRLRAGAGLICVIIITADDYLSGKTLLSLPGC